MLTYNLLIFIQLKSMILKAETTKALMKFGLKEMRNFGMVKQTPKSESFSFYKSVCSI